MNITSSSSNHIRNTSMATEIPKSENATKWLNFSITQNSSLTTTKTQDLNTTTLDHRAEKELTARQNTTSTARPSFTVSKGKQGVGYRNYTADGSRKNDTIQGTTLPTGNKTKVPLSALRPTNSPITITPQDISNRTLNFTQLSTLLLNASHGLSTMAPKALLSNSLYNETGLLNSSLVNTTSSELPLVNGSMVWDNNTFFLNSSGSSRAALPNTVTELPFLNQSTLHDQKLDSIRTTLPGSASEQNNTTDQPARTTQLMDKLTSWYQSLFNTTTFTQTPTTQTVNDHFLTTPQAEPEKTTEVTTEEITTKQGVKGSSSTPVMQDSYHAGGHITVKPKPVQGGYGKSTPSGQQGLGLGIALGGLAAGGLGAGIGVVPQEAVGAGAMVGVGAVAPGGAAEAAVALGGGEEAADLDVGLLEEYELAEEAELAADANQALEDANIIEVDVEEGEQFLRDMLEVAQENPGNEQVLGGIIATVGGNHPELLEQFLERLAEAGIEVPAGAAGGAAGGAGGAAGGAGGAAAIALAGGAAGGGAAIASSSGGVGQGVPAKEYLGSNSTEQMELPDVLNSTDPVPVTTLVDKVTSMTTSVLPDAIISTKPTDSSVQVNVTSAYINELTAGNTTSLSPSTQSVSSTKGMDRESAIEMIKKLNGIRGDLKKLAQKMVHRLERQFNISDTLRTTTVTPVTTLPTSSTTMDRESVLTLIERLRHIRGDLGQMAQEMMVKLQEQLNDEKESATD